MIHKRPSHPAAIFAIIEFHRMPNDFTSLLGMQLLEIAKTDIVQPLMAGSKTELIHDTFHMQFPLHGLGIVADFDGRVSTVFFYSQGIEDCMQFSGALPEAVSFGDSRHIARQRLGVPSASGGGNVIQYLGKVPKWDLYVREGYSLHLQYVEFETSISLVTLMRPDSVPR